MPALWWGEANVDLKVEQAFKVGRFLGWYYGQEHKAKVVIGKDTRRSSYMLEYALSAGLTASGADAYLLHVTTTPSVSYVARTEGFDCGVMISASHNPFYDNGIKLLNRDGEKMDEEVLALAEMYLEGCLEVDGCPIRELPQATGDGVGAVVDHSAGRNRYIGYLISLAVYSFKGKKVALDCANGSSWAIAPSVFRALGADVYVLNDRPDGVNINHEAGSTHIEGLQQYVMEHGMDVGFAYDGDADRCLAIDETGAVVDGDKIMYIYARYKALDDVGIDYAKTAVGDKYVYEHMVRHGNRIGGEQSGHIIFSKYARTGDGILTSLKLMEVMLAKKLPLSRLAEPVAIYPQVLINVRVKNKKAAQEDPAVKAAVDAVAAELGTAGRILVRESGTEPLVRIMVEAESQDRCQDLAERVVNVIRSQGHGTEA